jgi:WhiB family redox-sensing transcriptional regulator
VTERAPGENTRIKIAAEAMLAEVSAQRDTRNWSRRGACRTSALEPDAWFPVAKDSMDAVLARRICEQDCTVQAECLNEALQQYNTIGIWGGLDETERRSMMRRRARHGNQYTKLKQQTR